MAFNLTKIDQSQIENLSVTGGTNLPSGTASGDILVWNGTWESKPLTAMLEEVGTVITTEKQYTKRVDFYSSSPTTGDIIFKGWADVGTVNSTSIWRIAKLTINTDGDVTEQYADGNNNFDNIWDNRAILTYT
jgi:hypothetical protein